MVNYGKNIKNLADTERLVKPVWEEISKRLLFTIEKSPEVFYGVSKYGWYIDLSFSPRESFEFYELTLNDKISEVDETLGKHFEDNLSSICQELVLDYPSREHLFLEGFQNYREGRYASSITLLLTQVDGICYDKCQKLFFRNQRSKEGDHLPEIEEEISKIKNAFVECVVSPIQKPSVINEHTLNLGEFPVDLNRHLIIHGMALDFGSRINSLKVISLLYYMKQILEK